MRGNFITDRKGDKNPNYKHGQRKTRLYRIWANMKSRCHNPKTSFYNSYGGKGVTVCPEWKNDFQVFHDWAISHGYSDDLSIDRIDVNGNYEPGNCRWVSTKAQAKNRSNNHIVIVDGVSKSLMEWCEIYSINYKTVRDRLKRGWAVKLALETPVKGG